MGLLHALSLQRSAILRWSNRSIGRLVGSHPANERQRLPVANGTKRIQSVEPCCRRRTERLVQKKNGPCLARIDSGFPSCTIPPGTIYTKEKTSEKQRFSQVSLDLECCCSFFLVVNRPSTTALNSLTARILLKRTADGW